MSFNVNWDSLETESLSSWTTELLTGALNSGKRPNILASDITIKDLNFGKIAPQFEILEVGELDKDRFRGIFKITYDGNFHLTLHTKVQANPLKIYSDNSKETEISPDSSFITPEFLLSTEPFNIPLDLKLSDIKISGIGIIVFSKTKGLTLVFRNDPLDSIKVSSTFDTVQVLSNFLQTQIETQIRDLFRETLPTLIHKLSLKYTSSFQSTDLMDQIADHLRDQAPTGSLDAIGLDSVSPRNLNSLAKLYSSRETLALHVPKLKRIVQRNHLEKFTKNNSPSLAKTLCSNMNLPSVLTSQSSSNSIPVDVLVSSDCKKVESILKEISSIQAKSFRSGNTDNKRAKRRTIKLGKKSSKPSTDSQETLVETSTQSCSTPGNVSEQKDVPELEAVSSNSAHIHHPTPLKVKTESRPSIRPTPDQTHDRLVSSVMGERHSPLGSSSSFVGGVGLGHSYYNLANSNAISTSPIKKEHTRTPVQEHPAPKVKKSINHVDIQYINEKLQQKMKLDTKDAKRAEFDLRGPLDTSFEMPPPPYHHTARAAF